MPKWQVRLLGSLHVSRAGEGPIRFRTRATEAIFAFLALHAGKEVLRDTLVAIGWPEADDESGRRNLRTALTSLRQSFGADCIEADRRTVRLMAEQFDIDVYEFRSGRNPSVYGGRLLDGMDCDWAIAYAMDLEEAYFELVLERMDELPKAEALHLARQALVRDPSRLDVRAKLRELGSAVEAAGTPYTATSFIGRERELAELAHLFDTHRLVTLTGPGGCGKTRIAAEMWRRCQPNSWFVALVGVHDAKSVPEEIRISLRVPGSLTRTPIDQVAFALAESDGLLVIDNFEQILEAAPQLVRLLSICPQLRLLVTSQVLLGLPQELEYPVGTMSLEAEEGTISDGHRLFLARAVAANPRFDPGPERESIRRLCALLDGYPLALEIAAAKARILSPGQMIEQLDNRFEFLAQSRGGEERHASLRNALDWTFERLAEPAQQVISESTVFRDGFTIGALETVCEFPNLSETLEYLAANSWIERAGTEGEARFRTLMSIRDYGDELLPPRRRAELRKRHAAYYLQLAERVLLKTFTRDEPGAFKIVDIEGHNLDAAWEWLSKNDPDGALHLVVGLNWYWIARGHWDLAISRLDVAIANADTTPRPKLVHAHQCRGNYLLWKGRHREALEWYGRALAMAEMIDSTLYRGLALIQIGQIHGELGDYALGGEEARQGTDLLIEDGNENWIGAGFVVRSLVANREGSRQEALHMALLAVEHCRAGGYPWGLASALNELAMAYHQLGRFDESIECQAESIAIKREDKHHRSLALSLVDLAATLAELGRDGEAAAALKEGLELQIALGIVDAMPRLFTTGARIFELQERKGEANQCLEAARRLVSEPRRWHAHLHPQGGAGASGESDDLDRAIDAIATM